MQTLTVWSKEQQANKPSWGFKEWQKMIIVTHSITLQIQCTNFECGNPEHLGTRLINHPQRVLYLHLGTRLINHPQRVLYLQHVNFLILKHTEKTSCLQQGISPANIEHTAEKAGHFLWATWTHYGGSTGRLGDPGLLGDPGYTHNLVWAPVHARDGLGCERGILQQ